MTESNASADPNTASLPHNSPTSTNQIPTSQDLPTRTETDSIGSLEIPDTAYWGVHTARANENFPIARRQIGRASCREGEGDAGAEGACAKANAKSGGR